MYRSISAMFKGPKSRVFLTSEHQTDYFCCTIGVKQGDSISPTLFACFLNDLSQQIKATNLGVKLNCGDEGDDHYKHVAIGIATMTLWNLWLNQVSRFIILSN